MCTQLVYHTTMSRIMPFPPVTPNGVKWDAKSKTYRSVLTSHTLRGVINPLSDYFYPSYEFERATLGNKTENKGRSARTSRIGMWRGVSFDRQIAKCVNVLGKCKPTKSNKAMCQLFTSIKQMGYCPVQAQVVVGSPSHNLATSVDLVCVSNADPTKLMIIEVKRGMFHYYDMHTHVMMTRPLNQYTDSVRHQHLLQLSLTRRLFEISYPSHRVQHAFVVVVDNNCEPHWIRENEEFRAVFADLSYLARHTPNNNNNTSTASLRVHSSHIRMRTQMRSRS
jgi:hypothetical protein